MRAVRITSIIALTLGIAPMAVALPGFMKVFSDTYQVKPDSNLAKAKCGVCHVPGTITLNPYGEDLKKAMQAANSKTVTPDILKAVEDLDSDKDGVKNIDEIKADTLPGDAKSK